MSEKESVPLAKQLAKASWLAPLLVFLMIRFLRSGTTSSQATQDMILTIVGSFLYLVGFLCGVTALFGLRRHGRKGILVPALIGASISGLLLMIVVTNFWSAYSHAKSPQAQLERTAASLSEGLPSRIDDDTSLESVVANEGELVFNYTLVNYKFGEIDGTALGEAMKPVLIDQLCEPMAAIWKAGFKIRTEYSSSDGQVLSEIHIVGSDCGV